MKRHIIWILTAALSALPSGCGFSGDEPIEIMTDHAAIVSEAEAGQKQEIIVYICGAVVHPGVYHLEENSRIADLLKAAGGPSAQADLQRINLAQKLNDGQQVIVYTFSGEGNAEGASGSGRVNLNFATMEELMTLPGIGEAKAKDIIAYREETGWFTDPEEIMNISGIKEKMYARIADLIEV